jgi:hypothetical protein
MKKIKRFVFVSKLATISQKMADANRIWIVFPFYLRSAQVLRERARQLVFYGLHFHNNILGVAVAGYCLYLKYLD